VVSSPELKEQTVPATPEHEPDRMSVHFSSQTDVWATPESLFRELDAEFGFTLDVCALPENAKCGSFYTPEQDGLSQPWTGVCWMNPPYGRTIGSWVEKALASSREGATVVCLIPARTDTAWWHEYVTKADEVRFVRGRLRFGNAQAGAPFPSAIVIFRGRCERTTRWTRGVFFRRTAQKRGVAG
jgi:phage N-6-adenine-methyltransferase